LLPNEVVEFRFPLQWAADSPLQLASFSVAPDPQQFAFLPQQALLTAAMAGREPISVALFEPSPLYTPTLAASEQPSEPKSAATTKVASAVPVPRAAARPTLLNDAQIATVKQRLKLTPDQERMWPAVETALRQIAYKKDRNAEHAKTAQVGNAHGTGSIDPDSAEVQRLKTAAFPLVMSFNNEQKQEVRAFARIIGLENVATQF